jgi:hypothetical protein
MDTTEAGTNLRHRAVLWSVGLASFRDVVLAACDAVVAGCPGESLDALAAESVHSERRGTLDPRLVPAALAELGVALPADPQIWVAGELAQAVLAGRCPPRELARWAHQMVGHDGPEVLQPLVIADDEYDCDEGRDGEIDEAVVAWCRRHVGPEVVG